MCLTCQLVYNELHMQNSILKKIMVNGQMLEMTLIAENVYFVFSSIKGIQESLFENVPMEVSFINSFFDSAHKVIPYLKINNLSKDRIEELYDLFGIEDKNKTGNGFLGQICAVLLNEIKNKNLVIVETTGLATDS